MDKDAALLLAQRMWTKIQTQRHGRGVDEPTHAPSGLHGYLDYYRGVHKLHFASDEFAKYHLARYQGFTDNWCAPVIDASAERLNTTGIRLGEDTRLADKEFQRVADANDFERGLSEALTVAMAAGRSYALVWGNPKDESTPRLTFEHPEFCTIAYDPDTREATAAAKAWFDDEETGFLTLYTADEVWKWKWSVPKDADNRRQVTWEPRQGEKDDTWPIPNPIGRVPMEEFRNTALLDDRPISDLSGVASMQDAVNLIWAYLFNGLDFATMDQRVVTGADIPKVPVLNADGQKVGEKDADLRKLVSERILWVTGEHANIDAWPAANLDIFDRVIGTCVDHIAAQTRTPPHYLIGKMANMSADALTVAETGLVAKVIQRQANFTKPQRGLYSLIALAQGEKVRAKQALTGTIVWSDPQYRSLSQKIDAFQKWRASGLPLRFLLEWYGLDPSEVDRVMTMAETEASTLMTATPAKAPPGVVLPKGYNEVLGDSTDPSKLPAAKPSPAPAPEPPPVPTPPRRRPRAGA